MGRSLESDNDDALDARDRCLLAIIALITGIIGIWCFF